MKVRLTEEAKQVIFPLICDGKIVMHSPETLLEALQMYDKMYGKAKKKVGFWKGFGITMTIGALIFAKKWTKERLRADKLEQEIFDAEIEKAFDEFDVNDIFEEEDNGSNAS